jgi:hypothetical protein
VIAPNRWTFATAMEAIIWHDLRQIIFDLEVDPAVPANYLANGMTIA